MINWVGLLKVPSHLFEKPPTIDLNNDTDPSPSLTGAPMASPPPKKILFPIADGTEPMEAILPIDTLRRSGADVTIASVENHLLVHAMYDINIVADALLPDCVASDYDLIALPGGVPGSYTLRDCTLLETKVKSQAAEGKLYAAICAAPAVALGSWGLLKGLRATCTPLWMDQMPADAVVVESRVVVDGQVVTSRGSGTAIEFGLALIEQLYGKEKADEVAEPMVIRPQQGVEFHMKELNSIEWKHNNPPQILVPIANGTEEMEAVMIIDILRRAEAKVIVASVEDKLEIVASRKVKLVADTLLKDALDLEYDLIVLPGGFLGAEAFSNSKSLVDLLKRQAELGKLYGAICASPAIVLEPHGLLKDKKATAYPEVCYKLTDQSECENRVVVDGNLITSRGPGTTMEFALSIVEKLFGRETALEHAKSMVFMDP